MINLFQANLFHKKLGTNHDLLQQIKEIQRTNPSTNSATNDGCWRSDEKLNDIDWLITEVIRLLDQAVEHYRKEDHIYNNLTTNKACKLSAWVNVNQPHSRNVLHSHVGSHYSCVYYLQGKDCGALRLINPANLLGNCNRAAPFVRDFVFHPTDGDLILWPAWVPHEVEPNLSNRERINVVFDITLGEQ